MPASIKAALLFTATLALTASTSAQTPGFGDLASRPAGRVQTPADVAKLVDVDYSLRAKLRSFLVKADFWAGGKLGMTATRGANGRTDLALAEIVEAPWKFMWFAPKAIKAQSGYAADVTLAAGTWDARKAAEAATARAATERHQLWQQQWQGSQKLDWQYSFYVIGDPLGRFSAAVGADGAVSNVVNRMTARWLPHGFNDWVAGKPQEGYGYWGEEPNPPEYTPRCYDAFAKALELLAHPVLTSGRLPEPGDRLSLRYGGVLDTGRQVLELLAPKAKGRFNGSADFDLAGRVTEGPEGMLTMTLESPTVRPANGQGVEGSVRRTILVNRHTQRIEQDRVTVQLSKGDESFLALEVGYRPRQK